MPGFYLAAAVCLGVWCAAHLAAAVLVPQAGRGRRGPVHPPDAVPLLLGHFCASPCTLTLAAIMWMKALQYQWFSTMYGVYYFAGCVWVALAAAYVIAMILDRQGLICDTMGCRASTTSSARCCSPSRSSPPTSTSASTSSSGTPTCPRKPSGTCCGRRAPGLAVGLVLVFGHFFVPFLALLRIDVKLVFRFMVPLCALDLADAVC